MPGLSQTILIDINILKFNLFFRGVVDSYQRVYENSGISMEFSNFLEFSRIFLGSYGDSYRNFCIEF